MAENIKYKIKNLKVHSDNRGWLVELLKSNELEKPIKQLHISSIKKGRIRGNHYHSKQTEWLFLVSGLARLVLEDIKTKKRLLINLSESNPQVITIFPNISHAIKNIGKRTAYLVSAQSEIYNRKKPDKNNYQVY